MIVLSATPKQQQKETLEPTKTPDFPWSEVAKDLYQCAEEHYFITIDCFSKFIEVDKLLETNSQAVIQALKTQFCRHGIPELLRSDNGPQFSAVNTQPFVTILELKMLHPHQLILSRMVKRKEQCRLSRNSGPRALTRN